MKLTEKQMMMLYQILMDSLPIVGSPFMYTQAVRIKLADDILNQQDEPLEEQK